VRTTPGPIAPLAIAAALAWALKPVCRAHDIDTLVLSGGVFQNELLLSDLKALLEPEHLEIWTNHVVPANDGGISLGQAALGVFANRFRNRSLEGAKSEFAVPVT
jgi:hydrogenase maturation protein HypF